MQPILNFLSEKEVDEIHAASLSILEETGINVYHEEARDLLHSAGAKIEDNLRVRIPHGLVERIIEDTPGRIVIYNRQGEEKLFLEGNNVYFGTGSDLKFTIDLDTSQRRLSVIEDVEKAALVCDKLDNIDFIMSYGMPADVNKESMELYQLKAMLQHTSKPVILTLFSSKVFTNMLEIIHRVAGNAKRFKEKPFLMVYGQFVSPFQHNREGLDRLLFCAGNMIPIIYVPTIMAGASGPVTMAGSLAEGNAEVLAGLVIHQLKRKGAPFIYGGCIGPFDMRDSVFPYGAPEWHMSSAVLAQLSRRYRLPVFGTGGCCDSKVVDGQAAIEGACSLLLEALAGVNIIHDVGYMESGLTGALDYLVMMDETVGLVRRILRNFDITIEKMALEVINRVGPGGNFLGEEHTLKHFREEAWYPGLFNRQTQKIWEDGGSTTLKQRSRYRAKEILRNHRPLSLPGEVQEGIDRIIARPG